MRVVPRKRGSGRLWSYWYAPVGFGRVHRKWSTYLVVTTLVFANVLSIRVSNTAARGGPGYGERTCWAKFRPVLCEGLVAPWVSLLMGWILGAEDLSSDV